MIDFMVNIKNKKNMTMCNIKTLVATSVLCVFFNGVLTYGANEEHIIINKNENNVMEEEIIDPNNNKGEKNNKNKNTGKPHIEIVSDKILNGQGYLQIKKRRKKKDEEKFFPDYCYNYKGNFALLCCCNFCNGKKKDDEENPLNKNEELIEMQDFNPKGDNTNPKGDNSKPISSPIPINIDNSQPDHIENNGPQPNDGSANE